VPGGGRDDGRFGEVGNDGTGGAQVVRRREHDLHAAMAGGDGDAVEELDCLVGVGGVRLLCAEDGDAAADVAGERLHVLERGHLCLAYAGGASQFFQIKLCVPRHDGEDVVSATDGAEQGLEDLLRRHADLGGDRGG